MRVPLRDGLIWIIYAYESAHADQQDRTNAERRRYWDQHYEGIDQHRSKNTLHGSVSFSGSATKAFHILLCILHTSGFL